MFLAAISMLLQAGAAQGAAQAKLPDYDVLIRCKAVYSMKTDNTLAIDVDWAHRIARSEEAVGIMADAVGAKLGKRQEQINADLNGAYKKHAHEYETPLALTRGMIQCDRMTGLNSR